MYVMLFTKVQCGYIMCTRGWNKFGNKMSADKKVFWNILITYRNFSYTSELFAAEQKSSRTVQFGLGFFLLETLIFFNYFMRRIIIDGNKYFVSFLENVQPDELFVCWQSRAYWRICRRFLVCIVNIWNRK